MNSFTGSGSQRAPNSASSAAVSFDSYQFDFGIGFGSSSSARPLKDQKGNHGVSVSNAPFSSYKPAVSSSSSSPTSKPSWIHQPAATARSNLPNAAPSMVGDIFGRSWSSASPATASSSRLGIPENNPNLFSDLVGPALGQTQSTDNVPLKSVPPKSSTFSMAGLSDSLTKTNAFTSTSTRSPNLNSMRNFSAVNQSGRNLGGGASGVPMKSNVDTASNSEHDPFGFFMDFGSKPSRIVPLSTGKSSNFKSRNNDDSFGSFQDGSTAQNHQNSKSSDGYSFGAFQNAKKNDFGTPAYRQQNQSPQSAADADPLNMLFPSSASSAASSGSSAKNQPISDMNDWDVDAEFGVHDSGGTTTELEGLPPPPSGVTATAAKNRGLDNYKQGQFADAIKWLSWAIVLLDKSGNDASSTEVFTCRASCYKEVGEYKKAIADCSKVLEHESTNVSVLLQRALLYESSEKYRLGAEDLRMVLKIDPGNRLARSTIHRLNQFAD